MGAKTGLMCVLLWQECAGSKMLIICNRGIVCRWDAPEKYSCQLVFILFKFCSQTALQQTQFHLQCLPLAMTHIHIWSIKAIQRELRRKSFSNYKKT